MVAETIPVAIFNLVVRYYYYLVRKNSNSNKIFHSGCHGDQRMNSST